MADIRIKDLATTASSAASDDFMALDGATNGTRKMSAANPSVTTLTTSGVIAPGGSVHGANGTAANPSFAFLSDQDTGLYRISANNIGVAANGAKVLDIATTGLTVTGALGASSLTSPAATPLTLGTTDSGAAITVLSASNNVGIGTTTPLGRLHLSSTTSLTDYWISNPAEGADAKNWSWQMGSGIGSNILRLRAVNDANTAGENALVITRSGTTISQVNFPSTTGNVTISSTTAGSANVGALVIAGGISAGAAGVASYFGGQATISYGNPKLQLCNTSQSNKLWSLAITNNRCDLVEDGVANVFSATAGASGLVDFGSRPLSAGAATFAGAVTATNVNSATGTVSAPNATATTLFAASTRGMYQVYAYIDAYDPNDWAATAVVTNTGNGSTLKITATNAASFTLTVSGLNVRVTQSGGSTFDVAWRYVRIQ